MTRADRLGQASSLLSIGIDGRQSQKSARSIWMEGWYRTRPSPASGRSWGTLKGLVALIISMFLV